MLFDLKTLKRAVDQIAEEKGIDAAKILEAIESSIAAAYKKEYCEKGEMVKCKFDIKTGDMRFWQVKTVADETTVRFVEEGAEGVEAQVEMKGAPSREPIAPEMTPEGEVLLPRYNPDRHILVEEAKKIKSGANVGDEVEFALEMKDDFGRIAAQTAKQVILQRLREAERESVLGEFKAKEGEIVSGVIQRFDRGNVYIDLGRTTGILLFNETIQGERYRAGDRMRFYVNAVQTDAKMPGILLSRANPKFVGKLFAMEVPEINDGVIEVKAIAREPGNRTKIAVMSKVDGVDPVGSCVGQRGTRVMAVSNELGQEKLDIVEWSEDPAKFITNALSPAKVKEVKILQQRAAKVFIPEDQLSLAIGRGGQNVRLAAKLTGWKIDVRSAEKPEVETEGGVADAAEAEKSAEDGEPKVEA